MTATLKIDAVADALSVSTGTVETWIATGEMAAINVSRNLASRKPRLRVTQAALDDFIAQRTITITPTGRKQAACSPPVSVPAYI